MLKYNFTVKFYHKMKIQCKWKWQISRKEKWAHFKKIRAQKDRDNKRGEERRKRRNEWKKCMEKRKAGHKKMETRWEMKTRLRRRWRMWIEENEYKWKEKRRTISTNQKEKRGVLRWEAKNTWEKSKADNSKARKKLHETMTGLQWRVSAALDWITLICAYCNALKQKDALTGIYL